MTLAWPAREARAASEGQQAGVVPASAGVPPRLSVVVPATNAQPTLRRCLAAITACLAPEDELIVAREPIGAGPAEARNLAALDGAGDVLVFVDADVEVHADALARIRRRFADDPGLAALFGSYDDSPAAPGAVSNFRNLLHHHVHSSSGGPAETFWTGLGAVRRAAFTEVGGFGAARYPRPSVEDVEFGLRLRRAGKRIELDPAVRGCHLKRWSLLGMVHTDFARRGIPWTGLLIDAHEFPAVLNLSWRHRASGVASVVGVAALLRRQPATVGAALVAMVAMNNDFYSLLVRRRGAPEAALGVGLHVIHHLTAVASVPAGAAVHLRRRLRRARELRIAHEPNARPVSHDPRVAAIRGRPAATDELRVGLVGCGRLAERAYVDAFALARGVRLAAVADPATERCAAVAPGVPAFASAAELAGSGLVDAVVVASPAATHLDVASAAAGAGLAVLVEKPPATDAAGARLLAAIEPAPWLGFNRRFQPELERLALAVPAGAGIDLRLSLAARRSAWRAHDVRDDVLLDLAPHLVDLARVLSDREPDGVRAQVDGETVSLTLDLGERGRALIEAAGDRPWRERWEVRDAEGRELAIHAAGGLRAHTARLRRPAGPHPLTASLARQLEAFARAARGEDSAGLALAVDGVATMETIDAARLSAAAGGEWVPCPGARPRSRIAA